MLDVIIFSKDRPLQLDALLRSKENWLQIPHKTTVILKMSSPEYEEGYQILMRRRARDGALGWLIERDFEKDIKVLLEHVENPYTMFLVDDIVFKAKIEFDSVFEEFQRNERLLAVSLRLGKNITYSYARGRESPPPNFMGRFNIWNWADAAHGDWDYPMSVDGNVYKTVDIVPFCQKLSFNGPNIFENVMAAHPIKKPFMICYNQSKLMNLPINKVQPYPNRHGNVSVEHLNRCWLSGHQLRLKPLYTICNNMCHYEVTPEFEKR